MSKKFILEAELKLLNARISETEAELFSMKNESKNLQALIKAEYLKMGLVSVSDQYE